MEPRFLVCCDALLLDHGQARRISSYFIILSVQPVNISHIEGWLLSAARSMSLEDSLMILCFALMISTMVELNLFLFVHSSFRCWLTAIVMRKAGKMENTGCEINND